MTLPSRQMTSKQRRINVDETSHRDVASMLIRRYFAGGLGIT